MRRPQFRISDLWLATLATALVMGAVIGRVRHPARADEHDWMIVSAFLAAAALAFRRARHRFRRARLMALARRYAPPPRPMPGPRLDHSSLLESRSYRDLRTPRPLLRPRP